MFSRVDVFSLPQIQVHLLEAPSSQDREGLCEAAEPCHRSLRIDVNPEAQRPQQWSQSWDSHMPCYVPGFTQNQVQQGSSQNYMAAQLLADQL